VIAPPEAPSPSSAPRASSPRISQEFYDSPPVYSQPPLPSLPPLAPAPAPSRRRRLVSAALFTALFVPAIAVLAKVVVAKYDAPAATSVGQAD